MRLPAEIQKIPIEEIVVKKLVYFFGDGKAQGHAGMKDLLGGKG